MSKLLEAAENLVIAALRTAEASVKTAASRRQPGTHLARSSAIPIDSEVIDELSFRDLVTWATKHRPNDDRVSRAAVLRKKLRTGLRITTVFLDSSGEIVRNRDGVPFGRAQRVNRLDAEFEEFFGDADMILFA